MEECWLRDAKNLHSQPTATKAPGPSYLHLDLHSLCGSVGKDFFYSRVPLSKIFWSFYLALKLYIENLDQSEAISQ